MYCLPENCEITNVEQIYAELSVYVQQNKTAELDCSQVASVDSSFLQLVLSLIHSGIQTSLNNRSNAIDEILILYQLEFEGV